MRHIRARRRFRAVLIVLLALTFLIFFESRVESFAPQLRGLVEYRVGEAFGRDLKLSIGAMDGGILRPFVLSDVKINGNDSAAAVSSIEIKSIKSNLRIWDMPFKGRDRVPFLGLLKEEPCIYVDFVTKNKEVSGYVKLAGNASCADVQGYLIIFEKRKVKINGKIRSGSFFVDLRPRRGSLKIEGKISKDGVLLTNVRADHISFSGIDIVCEASLKNRLAVDAGGKRGVYLEGDIRTRGLILNYSVFPDVKASYRLYDGVINVSNFELGRGLKASGWGSLRDPYNVKIDCVLDNANLATILSYSGIRPSETVSGTVNARASLKGPVKDIKSSVSVSVRKGNIGPMEFESLEGKLKGDGPVIRIEDARLNRQSGFVSLAGEIDLRKMGKSTLLQQIRLITDDNAITWDKWESSSVQGVQQIQMKKKVFADVNVGFKKFLPDRQVDESMRDKDQVEVEYRLQPNDSLKLMVGDDRNYFGLEHKDKF